MFHLNRELTQKVGSIDKMMLKFKSQIQTTKDDKRKELQQLRLDFKSYQLHQLRRNGQIKQISTQAVDQIKETLKEYAPEMEQMLKNEHSPRGGQTDLIQSLLLALNTSEQIMQVVCNDPEIPYEADRHSASVSHSHAGSHMHSSSQHVAEN